MVQTRLDLAVFVTHVFVRETCLFTVSLVPHNSIADSDPCQSGGDSKSRNHKRLTSWHSFSESTQTWQGVNIDPGYLSRMPMERVVKSAAKRR